MTESVEKIHLSLTVPLQNVILMLRSLVVLGKDGAVIQLHIVVTHVPTIHVSTTN